MRLTSSKASSDERPGSTGNRNLRRYQHGPYRHRDRPGRSPLSRRRRNRPHIADELVALRLAVVESKSGGCRRCLAVAQGLFNLGEDRVCLPEPEVDGFPPVRFALPSAPRKTTPSLGQQGRSRLRFQRPGPTRDAPLPRSPVLAPSGTRQRPRSFRKFPPTWVWPSSRNRPSTAARAGRSDPRTNWQVAAR
jgi:hypothetical protein